MFKVLENRIEQHEIEGIACEFSVRKTIQTMYDSIQYLGDIGDYELVFNFYMFDGCLDIQMTLANPPEEHFTKTQDCSLTELKDMWYAHAEQQQETVKRYRLKKMEEAV